MSEHLFFLNLIWQIVKLINKVACDKMQQIFTKFTHIALNFYMYKMRLVTISQITWTISTVLNSTIVTIS